MTPGREAVLLYLRSIESQLLSLPEKNDELLSLTVGGRMGCGCGAVSDNKVSMRVRLVDLESCHASRMWTVAKLR